MHGITLKHCCHETILGVTIDNKLSFDEHIINICKTTDRNLNVVSRISHHIKKNQKETLPSFIISNFSYCPVIYRFCSKRFTKKINVVYKTSLRIILNDCESPNPLLLEEAHQITFHPRCINSPMSEDYKYLMDVTNDIFKLK